MIQPSFVTNTELFQQHDCIADKGYLYAVIDQSDLPFRQDEIPREWEIVCAVACSFAVGYLDSVVVRTAIPLWVVLEPQGGEWIVCGASDNYEECAELLTKSGSYFIVPGDKVPKLANQPSVFQIAA